MLIDLIVSIGDTDHGMRIAVTVGLESIGVLWGCHTLKVLKNDGVVHSISEILKFYLEDDLKKAFSDYGNSECLDITRWKILYSLLKIIKLVLKLK